MSRKVSELACMNEGIAFKSALCCLLEACLVVQQLSNVADDCLYVHAAAAVFSKDLV